MATTSFGTTTNLGGPPSTLIQAACTPSLYIVTRRFMSLCTGLRKFLHASAHHHLQSAIRPYKRLQHGLPVDQVPFMRPVALGVGRNPMAHGNIVEVEHCVCGYERRTARNGRHEEQGLWVASQALTAQFEVERAEKRVEDARLAVIKRRARRVAEGCASWVGEIEGATVHVYVEAVTVEHVTIQRQVWACGSGAGGTKTQRVSWNVLRRWPEEIRELVPTDAYEPVFEDAKAVLEMQRREGRR